MKNSDEEIRSLRQRIARLEAENEKLKARNQKPHPNGKTVGSPKAYEDIFERAQQVVSQYFRHIEMDPSRGTITINNDRYVLIRAGALSHEFFSAIRQLYRDQGEDEAFDIGQNFLFDIGHLIGLEDARLLHNHMNLKNPIEKLSAGPIHFAYSGWAFVEILPESRPEPNENFYLKYNHPYSFEADAWIKKGKKSDKPVCIMNAAYSSGWCEQSYGIELTAVEIACKARGDDQCTFIMAHPDKIESYLETELKQNYKNHKIPVFFERKRIESELRSSLSEKETLLKEIHHRVKNNLQIISSLLNLQFHDIKDEKIQAAISKSKNRINSMALVHTKLYQASNLEYVDFGKYLKDLTESIANSYATGKQIEYTVDSVAANFSIDLSINLGLLLNELLSNAYKHAFEGGNKGKIRVSLNELGDQQYELIVEDNGIGLGDKVNLKDPKSLGMEIVNSLCRQIEATIKVENSNGLKYSIRFKN